VTERTAGQHGRRQRFGRLGAFVAKERSVSVLIILLIVLLLGGIVLRVFVFSNWFLWFWAMTALTGFELLTTAIWDFVVDLRSGSLRLITDTPAPWPALVQAALVPLLLVAGILVDHFVVH